MRLVILNEEDEKRLESIVARTGRTQTEVVSAAFVLYEDALDAVDNIRNDVMSISDVVFTDE